MGCGFHVWLSSRLCDTQIAIGLMICCHQEMSRVDGVHELISFYAEIPCNLRVQYSSLAPHCVCLALFTLVDYPQTGLAPAEPNPITLAANPIWNLARAMQINLLSNKKKIQTLLI
ncbi:hypothetical protein NC653_036450 [Populus alba x Populus x berolinensis]|uniref:Uncharacterized protein n=1 Tax=Populus alba x Populus x berolinensis TaxID=444605 RepID=A0AAD6LJX2_9ROSI|nr:hypothetical protein NC653_036450 [Populus alba x Populus x berolinensis]